MHLTHRFRALVALVAVVAVLPPSAAASAQMPGIPVLQNAFTSPGIVGAVNVGGVQDTRAAALAGSWTPGAARFVVSGGAGMLRPEEGDDVFAWGARVAVPLPRPSAGNFGVGMFVGVGGASPDAGSVLQVPAGLSAGWRRAIGATRALSLYAAPFYSWSRLSLDDESQSAGHVRISVGLDFALTPSLGLTAGVEAGETADVDEPGPTGNGFGLGLSYAFGGGR